MDQATIDSRPADLATARTVGQIAAELATDRAEREAPGFRERAEAAVLECLQSGPASAESLTLYVKAAGIEFKDGRAMGSVYRSLKARGLIRIVGQCARRFGHGSGGGHLWARCG